MSTPDRNALSPHSGADTSIRVDGRAGRITLNRPKALNALTYPQVLDIWAALKAWQSDPAVRLVVLDGAGDRGLCAGGDVRALYDSAREGSAFARRFWRDEYHLNALIGSYPKPFVAIQDGIVMGGGIGLSGHASHRIVTERSALAMPETTIGLIPDVGGTWLLSRTTPAIGALLGLTGHRMNAADAILAGFSDTMVPSSRLGDLVAALAHTTRPVSEIIAAHAGAPSDCELSNRSAEIAAAFGSDRVEAMRDALARLSGTPSEDWARSRREELEKRSPKALKATLAAIRRARAITSLPAALKVEYRLAVRLFEDGEFIEGVRALIVDKDKSPRWNPRRLDQVGDRDIDALFAPLEPGAELDLDTPA